MVRRVIRQLYLFLFVMISLIIFTSCSLTNNGGELSNLVSDFEKFIPDLVKELPTKVSDMKNIGLEKYLTNNPKLIPKATGTYVPDTAMEAYWGGKDNGDMEWHSYVMLQGARNLGEIVMGELEANEMTFPEPGSDPISLALSDIEFMNAYYPTLDITISSVQDSIPYYIIEGFSGSIQVLRYIAIPDDSGIIERGYFVWANATEYEQPVSIGGSGEPSIHAKELVEILFDLTNPDNKQLRVDTVHVRLDNLENYGFVLRSTYNESLEEGTGQYISISKNPDTGATEYQDFLIKYSMKTLIKWVSYYDDAQKLIMETKEFGTDNQPTGNPCSLTVEEMGFDLLTSTNDAPIPYDYDHSNSRIMQILGNWDSYVTIDKILNF